MPFFARISTSVNIKISSISTPSEQLTYENLEFVIKTTKLFTYQHMCKSIYYKKTLLSTSTPEYIENFKWFRTHLSRIFIVHVDKVKTLKKNLTKKSQPFEISNTQNRRLERDLPFIKLSAIFRNVQIGDTFEKAAINRQPLLWRPRTRKDYKNRKNRNTFGP